MPLNDNALNDMADHFATLATKAAIYVAAPNNATGADNESTAARQDIAWNVAANGDITITAAENFTGGAANGPATHVGLWNTAGTRFFGAFALVGDQQFNASGEYTLNSFALNGSAT
jgi:hypothetical protein